MRGENRKVLSTIGILLGVLLAAILIQPLAAFGGSEKELVIVSWGGGWTAAERKAYFDPFEKETGIKIIDTTAVGGKWAQIRSQVESGNIEWDIVSSVAGTYVVQYKDLLEKIDYSIVTDTEGVIKQSLGEYTAGGQFESVNIAYNKDKFPGGNHPKTWVEFWDVKKFPGPRAFPNWGGGWFQPIAFALMADGVPPDKLIPFDYDRAFKKLDELKPHITVWWTSGSQFQQILRDEEVVLGAGWDGRIVDLGKDFPIGMEWNQGHKFGSGWAVVKGTKKKDLAMRFINSALDPNKQAVFTKALGAAPCNVKAFEHLTEQEKMLRGSYPSNSKTMFTMDETWLGENLKEMQEKWETWIAR